MQEIFMNNKIKTYIITNISNGFYGPFIKTNRQEILMYTFPNVRLIQ